jgi:tellurite resistance protein TerC
MSFVPWVAFLVLVFALLALDLGVLNRKVHEISTKEALKWTAFWIGLALLFGVGIYFMYEYHWMGVGLHEGAVGGDTKGADALMLYLSGYLIEKALSLDNIAVMAMIFGSFAIPLKYQHRVLFWGILGALVFRGIMIAFGAAVVSQWSSVLYIFGAVLIGMAIHSTFGGDDDTDPKDKWITKFMMKHFNYTPEITGMHFFEKIDGKKFITPLLVALVVIEFSDIIFAVDSIPAIFGITTDPFIVFTSNIFAILGLRSLYFVLASMIEKFAGLKYAIGFILVFVGVKLLIPAGYDIYNYVNKLEGDAALHAFHLPVWTSLVVVVGSVTVGIIGSLIYNKLHPEVAEKADEVADKVAEEANEAAEEANEAAEEVKEA